MIFQKNKNISNLFLKLLILIYLFKVLFLLSNLIKILSTGEKSKIPYDKERVLLLIQMDEYMKENGVRIRDMAMGSKNLVMEIPIKGSIT